MYTSHRNFVNLLLLGVCLINVIIGGGASVIPKKKQVCVIGSGVTGLVSIKQLSDHLDEFDVVAFEKNSDVGGLWIYSDSQDVDEHGLPVHSSMYKSLRTNLPKQLMAFPDYQEYYGHEERSCVTHETVVEYLKNYTTHFGLDRFIKFNTLVEKVSPVYGFDKKNTTKWQLRSRDLNNDEVAETTCDAVMVCNGHFFVPYVPKIPGIETFPGKLIHSHTYRKPEEFANRTVVILGAATSGIDLSVEISKFAKRVYLSHNKAKIEGPFPENVYQVSGVATVIGNTFVLRDSSTVRADAFVFATGYNYAYPFLDKSSGIQVDENYVHPLYKHLVNIENPSMGFIGVPVGVAIYPTTYLQAQYFVSLLQGKTKLPSKEVMLEDSKLRVTNKRHAHNLNNEWDYHEDLINVAHLEPLPEFYKRGYNRWLVHMHDDAVHFRDSNFRVLDDGHVQIIYPNQTVVTA